MNAQRRIVREIGPSMFVTKANLGPVCRATIKLDGRTYRCGRTAAHVDGIHDAFERHSDSGLVRW